jgi:hypothetical protein
MPSFYPLYLQEIKSQSSSIVLGSNSKNVIIIIIIIIISYIINVPIPVAVWSKAWVCGRSLTGTAG